MSAFICLTIGTNVFQLRIRFLLSPFIHLALTRKKLRLLGVTNSSGHTVGSRYVSAENFKDLFSNVLLFELLL